jgi:formylglycine-generating enzyme required for sulfatase activity
MKCSECDFENPEGMLFCGRCGAKLRIIPDTVSTEIACPECKATMPINAAFCGRCGHHLQSHPGDPESPQASPVVESPPNEAQVVTEEPAAAEEPVGTQESGTDEPGTQESSTQESGTQESSTQEPAASEPLAATVDLPLTVQVRDPNQKVTSELQSPRGAIREMVLLPAAWFPMGSVGQTGNGDERPRHQVELAAFYIDRCAVTNADYEQFDGRHRRMRSEVSEGDDDPVVFVTYEKCLEYCRWRDQREGVPPGSYCLPTEAQWEFAARGGFENRIYPWGNEVAPGDCNTYDAGLGRTVAVDDGRPNGFGLYHMGSNVREWCRDWYSDGYYATREATGPDPTGPGKFQIFNFRVVRGASFRDEAQDFSRCAARHSAHPPSSSDDIGFRCVRAVR